jgi:hypothetical protein
MRAAKRILLACTAMAAVPTSARAADVPIAYPTKAPPRSLRELPGFPRHRLLADLVWNHPVRYV